MKKISESLPKLKRLRGNAMIAAFTALSMLQTCAMASECYSDIKLPRLIASLYDSEDTWMMSMAASENQNALFVGGVTES